MGIKSEYLDLAIALAVVFFLTSLIVSGLNEGIQWILRVRSKFLWAFLHDLADPARQKALPRGFVGILRLLRGKNDKRPAVDDGNPALRLLARLWSATWKRISFGRQTGDKADATPSVPSGQVVPAVMLDRMVKALDPIDAPQLTGNKTAIHNIPPPSLAQAFLEVFADMGRENLDAAMIKLAEAAVNAPEGIQKAAAGVAEQVADPDDRPAVVAACEAFAELAAGKGAAAGQGIATALLDLPQAVEPPVPGDRLPALEAALLEAIRASKALQRGDSGADASTVARSSKAVEAAARKLSTGVIRTFPDRFGPRQRIEIALAKLDGSPFGATARRLWESAETKIDTFRTDLEKWFDSEMSRLGGYYKRSIRLILAVLALLVAFAVNIDAVQLTADLWRNPQGRAALVTRADELLDSPVPTAPSSTVAGTPGAPGAVAPVSPPTTTPKLPSLERVQQKCEEEHPSKDEDNLTGQQAVQQAAQTYNKVRTCVSNAVDQLSELNLIDRRLGKPGWAEDWDPRLPPGKRPQQWWLHLLGVMGTALALLLGAPFWFDLLKRLTGLRGPRAPRT